MVRVNASASFAQSAASNELRDFSRAVRALQEASKTSRTAQRTCMTSVDPLTYDLPVECVGARVPRDVGAAIIEPSVVLKAEHIC